MPQYYVENSHEAIIPRDVFMRVQEEMHRRANLHSGRQGKKRVYSSKYALSSIVYCSNCGDIYRRIQWRAHGEKYTVWRCCNRVENGPAACDADAILEEELHDLVVQAINRTLSKRENMKVVLASNIESVLTEVNGIPLGTIDSQLEELQNELIKVANAKGNYDSIVDEIYRLREAKQNAQLDESLCKKSGVCPGLPGAGNKGDGRGSISTWLRKFSRNIAKYVLRNSCCSFASSSVKVPSFFFLASSLIRSINSCGIAPFFCSSTASNSFSSFSDIIIPLFTADIQLYFSSNPFKSHLFPLQKQTSVCHKSTSMLYSIYKYATRCSK